MRLVIRFKQKIKTVYEKKPVFLKKVKKKKKFLRSNK